MKEINTRSTSLHTAIAEDVTLRETKTTRLIFRPLLIDNPGNKDACVKGQFLFQKKSTKDDWEDSEAINLARLHAGDGVKLDLKSAELQEFYKSLTDLYSVQREFGTQPGRNKFTKSNPLLASLGDVPTDELMTILGANKSLGGELLTKLLEWATNEQDPKLLIERLLELAPDSLKRLNTSVNLQRMKNAVLAWSDNRESNNEDLWQELLTEHIHVLEQVYSWPVTVVGEKAFVGGKGVDNKGGGLVDYLLKNTLTSNVTLIEIKTPGTKLLKSKEYRTGIYNTSDELSGAVMQVLNYRNELLQNYKSLDVGGLFDAFDPKCVVVLGHAKNELLGKNQRKSFELFRNQLPNVDVVTYDELFGKTMNLIRILEEGS